MTPIRCLLLGSLVMVACNGTADSSDDAGKPPPPVDASTSDSGDAAETEAAPPQPSLPDLTFCVVSDPMNPSAAYTTQSGDGWMRYSCSQTCADWHDCVFGLVGAQGQPTLSARGNQPMQGLWFVVDDMAGHFVFTPDGTDVIVSHSGDGGTDGYNGFDRQLQSTSNLKTVTLGWEPGVAPLPMGGFAGGTGWFTRRDSNGTNIRALAARPAAALAWLKASFAPSNRFGTVAHSMGTLATLGAHVWYGLDSIFDYQMLIGGPGAWDVNAGCGRVHIAQGHCDVDAAPCTGNPNSSYGNDDPACPGNDPTNQCRVPTIMAQAGSGSVYDNLINYVGATTSCAPTAQDSRDTSLDVSSMAFTVTSWSFHGRVDFIADEGGAQPPNADQGMGEGHMLDIYEQLTGPKSWTDNEGTHHPDAWKDNPTLVGAAAQKVVEGMSP